MVVTAPRLLALDWGSTSLRGYLLDGIGTVLAQRSSEAGVSKLGGAISLSVGDGGNAFEGALRKLAGDWLEAHPGIPIVACGMVGSKHGWAEAPYVAVPAVLGELAAKVRMLETASGLRVRIIPGLAWHPPDGTPEVMRGEETQVVALLATQLDLASGCRIVLPGTHSKWVRVRQGTVLSFGTFMTGELFDVLMQHSVLGRTARPAEGALDANAFEQGVATARTHGGGSLVRLLFGARTLGLFGRMTPAALADYASGLLIGSEITSATGTDVAAGDWPIRVVGAEALAKRYLRALHFLGCEAEVADVTAASGIAQVAIQGKWLE